MVGALLRILKYSSIPDEVNQPILMLVHWWLREKGIPCAKIQHGSSFLWLPSQTLQESQSRRALEKVVWRLSSLPTPTLLAFIKKQIGPKIDLSQRVRIWFHSQEFGGLFIPGMEITLIL